MAKLTILLLREYSAQANGILIVNELSDKFSSVLVQRKITDLSNFFYEKVNNNNYMASFCSLVMEGRVPDAVHPLFFGASLVALEKTSGGVRPIAVGCSFRRLIAKIAGQLVIEDMATLLSPRQLGYGVRGGAEVAVHAARKYLQSLPGGHVLLKLDFQNAFNSIH